jgi:hypothetical protein
MAKGERVMATIELIIELTIEIGFVLSGGKDLKEADCWCKV